MSLDSLLVYKSNYPKIRVGSVNDGGYVVADGLSYDVLLSCGIANDITFEKDFLQRNPSLECFAFDGTIQALPEQVERLHFIKRNIGPLETDTTTNLHYLIERYDNIFLKMDIESYEFRWLQTLSTTHLQKIKQIVIEFHYPFTPANFSHFDVPLPPHDKMAMLEKVAQTHTIVHLHGNNCCGTTQYHGIQVPNIFECTYLRNDVQNRNDYNTDLIPSSLDKPNISGPDIQLTGYPFVAEPKKIKEVTHVYLQKTTINANIGAQPPGLADFLRGTIALHQLANKHNYTLKFDISHPIYKFLQIPDTMISDRESNYVVELLPPYSYHEMPIMLDMLFKIGNNFSILTNCFYDETVDTTDDYKFLKRFLTPNAELKTRIEELKRSSSLDFSKPYTVIHIRLGDKFLINNETVNMELLNKIRFNIESIKSVCGCEILLIADSKELKAMVKDICHVTSVEPIHTGSLAPNDVDKNICDTLAEFFIMGDAKDIICMNFWDGSGYSKLCAKLYSKPYYCIKL